MGKVRIYRMENEEGVGPFVGHDDLDFVDFSMPTIGMDAKVPRGFVRRSHHVFGCTNKKTLKAWVKSVEKLEEYGFMIKTYTVPRECATIGSTQSVFKMKDAKLTKVASPRIFFKGVK